MENLIEVHGLCKHYKGFALENVDLTVPAGTIVGLIGENHHPQVHSAREPSLRRDHPPFGGRPR